MTVHVGTEEYDAQRKVWEIPDIRLDVPWSYLNSRTPHRLSVLIGWPSRLLFRTMASTHLGACGLYLYMSKVAFCYVRCLTCMHVLMLHTRAARSAKRIVVGSTAFVADEQATTYHRCSQISVSFSVLMTLSAYEITMMCVCFSLLASEPIASLILNC